MQTNAKSTLQNVQVIELKRTDSTYELQGPIFIIIIIIMLLKKCKIKKVPKRCTKKTGTTKHKYI